MPTDRQRVEMALFPLMMLHMFIAGMKDTEHSDYAKVVGLLNDATLEAVADLPDRKATIMRRTTRLNDMLLQPFRFEGMDPAKAALRVFYALQMLHESGALAVPDDGKFRQALAIICPAIEHVHDDQDVDDEAHDSAIDMLIAIKREGYFQNVTVTEAA